MHETARLLLEADSRCANKLVWPGITGQTILCVPVLSDSPTYRWERLLRVGRDLDLQFEQGENIDRFRWQPRPNQRTVVVIDPFEERPQPGGWQRNTPREYLDFISDLTERTRGSATEIVFVIYCHTAAFEKVDHGLTSPELRRLKHYLTLHQDIPDDDEFRRRLRLLWNQVQRDLLRGRG